MKPIPLPGPEDQRRTLDAIAADPNADAEETRRILAERRATRFDLLVADPDRYFEAAWVNVTEAIARQDARIAAADQARRKEARAAKWRRFRRALRLLWPSERTPPRRRSTQ